MDETERTPIEIAAKLIDARCERRALKPLRCLLNGWPPNGLTDGWIDLYDALSKARAFGRDDLTPEDDDLIGEAMNKIDRALNGAWRP